MKSVPSLLFFKPMREEPPKWVTAFGWSVFTPDGHISGRGIDNGLPCEMAFKLPYRPGEKCYVREAWRPECPTEGTYRGFLGTGYKDGAFKLTGWPSGFEAYPNGKWRSPVTMPQWAARSFVTVLSCEPVRVSEVTEEDIIKAGLADGSCVWANGAARCNAKGDLVVNQFVDNWHKRHPDKEWAWRVVSGITG